MKNRENSFKKSFIGIIAITGWVALVGQFYLTLVNSDLPVQEIIIRYFSYFTILTNIMIAIYSTMVLLFPAKRFTNFLSRQATTAAIVVYITVVGLIYNTILRFTWEPKGFQRIVDELLHLIIPILFISYWIVCVKKDRLKWENIPRWLIYPLVYIVIVLLRGIPSGFYPYPFIDVSQLGYQQVFINSMGITLAFGIISVLILLAGKIARSSVS